MTRVCSVKAQTQLLDFSRYTNDLRITVPFFEAPENMYMVELIASVTDDEGKLREGPTEREIYYYQWPREFSISDIVQKFRMEPEGFRREGTRGKHNNASLFFQNPR